MSTQTLRLPVHSYKLRSPSASSARLLNCYAERLPEDAKTPIIISRAPGIDRFATVGNGNIRGKHAAFGYDWIVSGNSLYRLDELGTSTLIGTVGAGAVDMDHNTDTVVVVTAPDAYYYNKDTAVFGQITDADFTALGATDVEFLNNFLLFCNSDVFFGADLGSATSFDALNFASAEASPDSIVGMKTDHAQAVIAGENTMEIWDNTPIPGFPFQRSVNGFVELGCFAGKTLQKLDNSVIWLASDYTIRRLQGNTPVRISTHAVEQFLTTTTVSSGTAFTYTQDGHLFYVLSFLEGTWAYDATTNEWHERKSYGLDYWRWKYQSTAFGKELVGDANSNVIGSITPLVYDEDGDTQVASWEYQPVYAQGQRAFHDRLEVVMETGVGLTSGQGSDPEMMMDYSDDGGLTWKSLPNKKIGAIGKYQARVIWNSLGSSRMRVYRGSVSDPVKFCVTDTLLTVRGGRL